MKQIRTELGMRILLPDYAYIEIWEQSGEWLVDIHDSEKTVQIKMEENSEGRMFKYYNDVLSKKESDNAE